MTTSSTGWNLIGAVESGYNPSSDTYFTVFNVDDVTADYAYITSSGDIYLHGKHTSKLIRGSVTYIKGA